MLEVIRTFFEQHLALQRGAGDIADTEQRTRLAAVALLVEVIRMDDQITDAEREQVLTSVVGKFGLAESAARELLRLAEAEAHAATDVYQFTSQINQRYTPEQKTALIEHLWRAAYADGTLNKYEEHLVRKIAELIYVPHTAFIAAKHRVIPDGT